MQREKALRCYYKKKEAKKGDIQKWDYLGIYIYLNTKYIY
jgi:hypothetical protein